ncbi:hypothetical protein HMPREF9699_01946 [Bergeyella zoohelcum ATCC 43767]|uniref:DUF4241 domain-containing protein n=3 Tax=Bergeyella zoohelcum TaxID=1015 RepID=K1LWC1_9FLAO|nr:hypothetical protein HMPREF9699_01946 [Bergeyella zoohelcum ATCC 43767]EKB60455.1 hypothetical protein HMPREF9700_01009 [Bergeyella zoohelcum CCUG 30536]SSZ46393.1 Uncharacterised protein [Bergeyella zoohelcum]SUV49979.1 Uncharacterised protein [Bergeyella zoohelcum]
MLRLFIMQHLENIQKLFTKPFVEHPLIESFDIGKLHISSGKLVACDPLTTADMPAFEQEFPKGDFQVTLHTERESNCIAYIELVFGEHPITEWKLATLPNQNIRELKKDEIFGYPVQSGMGSLMDMETQIELNELEKTLFERKGDDYMGIYEEFFHPYFFDNNGAIDQYAFLSPADNEKNIVAFEAGMGEGLYASYIGLDQNGKPQKFITEFIEIAG